MLADRIEDHVVGLAVLGEVFHRVVDDLAGAERSHELEILRAADGGDVGFEVLGQLHPCRTDSTGRTVDEDPLPFPEVRQPEAPERVESSVANRRSFLEAHAGWLGRDPRVRPYADELGMCAEPEAGRTEYVVTHRELVDGCADRCDLARELSAEDPLLRSAKSRDEAANHGDREPAATVGFTSGAVRSRYSSGADFDEDLVVLRDGPLDLFDVQNFGGPISVIDHCSHGAECCV